MKLLFVSSLWPPAVLGGAEIYAARLAGELRARGHDVGALTLGVDGDHVITEVPAWPYRLDDYVGQPAWRRAIFHGRDLYDPQTALLLPRTLRRYQPDVVHSHAVAGLSTAALRAPRSAGVAHVHHLHDYWLLCQRVSFTTRDGEECDRACTACVASRHFRSAVLRRHGPHRFIAPSQFVADVHAQLSWVRDRIDVLHLPLETDPRPARPWAPGQPLTFGYIGQLSVVKGIRTLLAAFGTLAADGAQLLVAGRGAVAGEVRGPGVRALGWVDGDAREAFWDAIDCLVVPSQWAEPAGAVCVEARARGLPVIAAATGGLVEHVEPASRPLLFESGDVDGLVASMRRVAADPRPFRPGPNEWPTWPDHVDGVEAVYDRALSGH